MFKRDSVGKGTLNNTDTQRVATSHNPLQIQLSLLGFPVTASHRKSLREETRGFTNSSCIQRGKTHPLVAITWLQSVIWEHRVAQEPSLGNINLPGHGRLHLIQHTHLQIKIGWNFRLMTFDVTAGEDEGLSQPKPVQIEVKFIASAGSSAEDKQDSRVLTGEQLL